MPAPPSKPSLVARQPSAIDGEEEEEDPFLNPLERRPRVSWQGAPSALSFLRPTQEKAGGWYRYVYPRQFIHLLIHFQMDRPMLPNPHPPIEHPPPTAL